MEICLRLSHSLDGPQLTYAGDEPANPSFMGS